jgi:hypothetical protein
MSRSTRRERAGNCAEGGAVKMLNNLTVTTLMSGDGRIAGRTSREMAKRRGSGFRRGQDFAEVGISQRSGFRRGDERGEERQPGRRLSRFLAAGGYSSNPA